MSDAKANALCIVIQGSRPNVGGATYGQGVRCVGGTLVHLFITTTQSDGAVIVPDFEAGDPTVNHRSAELGYPILPTQTRWYMAIYRDPVVLGSCPAMSTFNTTQTREVHWLP